MLSFEEMKSRLGASISPHRYVHSLGVTYKAVELAQIYGADEEKCRLAGLLHDCAKGLKADQMLKLINENNIELYPGEADMPELLHAPAGMALAKNEYGVTDNEILSAIRSHTVGSRSMSLIDAIIFVSDFIEPSRKEFEGLETVRKLARTDIFAAVEECKRLTGEYCAASGKKVFTI